MSSVIPSAFKQNYTYFPSSYFQEDALYIINNVRFAQAQRRAETITQTRLSMVKPNLATFTLTQWLPVALQEMAHNFKTCSCKYAGHCNLHLCE